MRKKPEKNTIMDIKYQRILWLNKRIKELRKKIWEYKIKYGLIMLLMISLSGCAMDKSLHIITSFGITRASYAYCVKNTDYSDNEARLAGFIIALSAGFIKECLDKKFDWSDIGADLVGAAGGAVQ